MSKTLNEKTKERYESDKIDKYIERSKKAVFTEKYLDSIINKIPENGTFIDVGCGVGVFLKQLYNRAQEKRRKDISFSGFDYSPKMLGVSREECEGLDIKIFEDNLLDLKVDEKFDYVFSRDVLFFFDGDDRKHAFANLKELCKEKSVVHIVICEKDEEKESVKREDFSKEELRELLKNIDFEVDSLEIGKDVKYGDGSRKRLVAISHPRQQSLGEPSGAPLSDGKAPLAKDGAGLVM